MTSPSPQTDYEQQYDLSKVSRLTRILIKGAMRDPNEALALPQNGKAALKSVLNPFRLPKVNFLKAPDVRGLWRMFCLAALRVMHPPVRPARTFEEVMSANKITTQSLSKIELTLKRSAYVSGFFFLLAILVGIYYNSLNSWLTSIGAMVLSGVLYWKYSFLLWQTRLRSLDPNVTGMRKFMSSSWWLESLR